MSGQVLEGELLQQVRERHDGCGLDALKLLRQLHSVLPCASLSQRIERNLVNVVTQRLSCPHRRGIHPGAEKQGGKGAEHVCLCMGKKRWREGGQEEAKASDGEKGGGEVPCAAPRECRVGKRQCS